MGLAPQSAAKDRSECSRSALSPAVSSSVLATSGPTPVMARICGGGRGGDPAQPRLRPGELVVELVHALGELAQREPLIRDRDPRTSVQFRCERRAGMGNRLRYDGSH